MTIDRLEWDAETLGVDAAIARARANRHPNDRVLAANAEQAEDAAARARTIYEREQDSMPRRKHTTAWAKARDRRQTKRRVAQHGDPRNYKTRDED